MSPKEPVEITPPNVAVPTSVPRPMCLIAWAKISAFEKEFSLISTLIGLV